LAAAALLQQMALIRFCLELRLLAVDAVVQRMPHLQVQVLAGPVVAVRDSQRQIRVAIPGKVALLAKVMLVAQVLTAVLYSAAEEGVEEKHRQALTVLVQELRHLQGAKAEMALL
jgi:hypothetical protein